MNFNWEKRKKNDLGGQNDKGKITVFITISTRLNSIHNEIVWF